MTFSWRPKHCNEGVHALGFLPKGTVESDPARYQSRVGSDPASSEGFSSFCRSLHGFRARKIRSVSRLRPSSEFWPPATREDRESEGDSSSGTFISVANWSSFSDRGESSDASDPYIEELSDAWNIRHCRYCSLPCCDLVV